MSVLTKGSKPAKFFTLRVPVVNKLFYSDQDATVSAIVITTVINGRKQFVQDVTVTASCRFVPTYTSCPHQAKDFVFLELATDYVNMMHPGCQGPFDVMCIDLLPGGNWGIFGECSGDNKILMTL